MSSSTVAAPQKQHWNLSNSSTVSTPRPRSSRLAPQKFMSLTSITGSLLGRLGLSVKAPNERLVSSRLQEGRKVRARVAAVAALAVLLAGASPVLAASFGLSPLALLPLGHWQLRLRRHHSSGCPDNEYCEPGKPHRAPKRGDAEQPRQR